MTLIAPNNFPLSLPPLSVYMIKATFWMAAEKPEPKQVIMVQTVKTVALGERGMAMKAMVSMKSEMRARMRSKCIAWDWISLEVGVGAGEGGGEWVGEEEVFWTWSGWRGSEGVVGSWIGRALGLKMWMMARITGQSSEFVDASYKERGESVPGKITAR